jgi:hypothetical protein
MVDPNENKKQLQQIETAEMRFLRPVAANEE